MTVHVPVGAQPEYVARQEIDPEEGAAEAVPQGTFAESADGRCDLLGPHLYTESLAMLQPPSTRSEAPVT